MIVTVLRNMFNSKEYHSILPKDERIRVSQSSPPLHTVLPPTTSQKDKRNYNTTSLFSSYDGMNMDVMDEPLQVRSSKKASSAMLVTSVVRHTLERVRSSGE